MTELSSLNLTSAQRLMFAALQDPVPVEKLISLAQGLQKGEWRELTDLAINLHRVAPHVWSSLRNHVREMMPPETVELFEDNSRKTAMRALSFKAETARIVNLLNRVGIKPILIKGWTLEEDLFGSTSRRMMYDMDLMVSQEEMPQVASELKAAGYHCQFETVFGSSKRLEFFFRFQKDVTFVLPDLNIILEVHVRLNQFTDLLPLADLEHRPNSMVIEDTTAHYHTLTDSSCFLYLALHGSGHRWSRAKWLRDIPPLIHRMTNEDWHHVLRVSRAYSIEQAIGTALVLARDLLDEPIPAVASPLLEKADGAFATTICFRYILAPDDNKRRLPYQHWFFAAVTNLALSSKTRFRLKAVVRRLVQTQDIEKTKLSDRFLFLLYLVSPFKLFLRTVRRRA